MRPVGDHNSQRATGVLAAAAPDIVVFTGGGLLRNGVLSVPRLGVLNCHMGILPRFRGMDVVEWTALESGLIDPGIGVTVHYMDEGVDTGPILLRQRTELKPDDDFASIRLRMERDMAALMVDCVRGLRDGQVDPAPQAAVDGRQYFVMHPALLAIAKQRLEAQAPTSFDSQISATVNGRLKGGATRGFNLEHQGFRSRRPTWLGEFGCRACW